MKTTLRSLLGYASGAALFGALTGCTTYVEQPRPRETYERPPTVYVQPAPVVVVEIRTENDFYEPLRPYGRWEVVGTHGRCWIPGRVDAGWRPYAHGNWERTDAGWYWVSDEPWAWATYHYGRWDLSPQWGWYWVPQTQWAPAWVSWHEGGGYVGWAPLHPSVRFASGGAVAVDVALIAPRAYVFVEPRHFLKPVRPATVVVNNTTIIHKTVNITNVKIVNNTVINEGPRTTVIEEASGQKLQPVPVRELRRKQEAEVAARVRTAPPGRDKKEEIIPPPVRTGSQPGETKAAQDTARRVKEAEARRQALESERAAQQEAQQRRQILERKAQAEAEAQRSARELEKRNGLESQRRANEAAAKAQAEARSKALESERAAQREAQQRRQEADRKAQAETENKTYGRPELRPKQGKIPVVPGRTSPGRKPQKKNAEEKPSAPENPPGPPKSSP